MAGWQKCWKINTATIELAEKICHNAPYEALIKLGRKPKLTDHQKREAMRRRDHHGEPVREIARSYNVSHSTISRLTA